MGRSFENDWIRTRHAVRTRHALSLRMPKILNTMDIRYQLLQEASRFNSDYIANVIGNNEERFAELMNLLLKETDPIPPRAAWVAETIYSSHPELIKPYIKKLVQALPRFTHNGTRRCVLKILSQCKIPEKLHGPLIAMCFEWMTESDQPVAVKVHAMQIIANHLYLYPDLAFELNGVIEDQWDKNTVAFMSRGKRVLKDLQKYL